MFINPFRSKRNWPLLFILLCGFLALFFRYGVVYANDSYTYLNGSVRVSPLYPLLILLFQSVFSTDTYLQALVVFQEILTAYAIFSLMAYVRERFRMRGVVWYFLGAAFACAYILRLVMVGKEALYCNALLSEAVAYPLYFLFVKYAFAAWDEGNWKYFSTAFLFAFLLACVRGQMLFLFIFLFVEFLLLKRSAETKKAARRLWLKMLLYAACFFIGISAASVAYNYALTGEASQTTMGNEVILGALLYNGGTEDASLFPDGSKERAVLAETYAQAEAEGLTYASAPTGFLGRFQHYQSSFDPLRGVLMQVLYRQYGIESLSENEQRVAVAGFAASVVPRLFIDNLGEYLHNALVNCLGGLVRSNSILNLPGVLWSAFVYALCAICLLLTRKFPFLAREKRFLTLILVSTLSNAVFCAFGVFELSRYVYYNFPFFYLSVALFVSAFLPKPPQEDAAR